jgi:hypothetical protein
MATRNYEILRTAKTQQECQRTMAYPLGYVNDEWQEHYSLENILRPIVLEKDSAAAGDFPNNIQEFFWVRGGENDGDSWLSCGQLTNGNYFFYSGSCDYTGFDCQGGMSLWVSKSWKNIVDHAMGEGEYEAYQRLDGEEPEGEPTYPLCSHCQEGEGGMPNEFTDEGERLCADCYWDFDAEAKRKRRSDPEWSYYRIISACKLLLNMSDEEACAKANQEVQKMEGGVSWLRQKQLLA